MKLQARSLIAWSPRRSRNTPSTLPSASACFITVIASSTRRTRTSASFISLSSISSGSHSRKRWNLWESKYREGCSMRPPVFTDILEAKRIIDRYLQPTPLHHYPRLSSALGFDVFIKHENHHPVGAFKIRGGINLISQLTAEEKRLGVITASTGNHGQSIAYASRLFGVKAIIGVPEGSNRDKVAAMRALGATVETYGRDFDEARLWVEEQAQKRGYRYIHSANEP